MESRGEKGAQGNLTRIKPSPSSHKYHGALEYWSRNFVHCMTRVWKSWEFSAFGAPLSTFGAGRGSFVFRESVVLTVIGCDALVRWTSCSGQALPGPAKIAWIRRCVMDAEWSAREPLQERKGSNLAINF